MGPGSGQTHPTTITWKRRAFRSSAASACGACRTCRSSLGSAWAATAPSSSSTAPRAGGAATWSRCRRRRAQSRAAHVRGDHGRGRRPRHHRNLARRPEEAAHLRMAARLDVLDPAQHQSPHRQRSVEPGADSCRDDRAERHEHLPRHATGSSIVRSLFRRASTAAQDFFKPKDDIAPDPLRGLGACARPISSPTS